MEGRKMKVFGVMMTLLLVFSFAATFTVSSTSIVSAGTQKWTKIAIPDTIDNQLAPNTDVGAIDVSPDGGTLFAAVYAETAMVTGTITTTGNTDPRFLPGNWSVFKSVDGGYEWTMTGVNKYFLCNGSDGVYSTLPDNDTTPIIDIDVSPAWEDDGVVVVTTQKTAYYSKDSGRTFKDMIPYNASTGVHTDSNGNAIGTINCLDIALDENGDANYVIGTTNDVYILSSGFGGWEPQYVGTHLTMAVSIPNALAVAFSPNYGEDGMVFAIIVYNFAGVSITTELTCESDITVNNWGLSLRDATITDERTAGTLISTRASLAFAEDFPSNPSVFVGLVATIDPAFSPADPQGGDAFRVDLVQSTIGTSAVTDLNIRDMNHNTNVYSIAVSGPASSAFILAGLNILNGFGALPTWTGPVHYSSNGGETWLQSYKPAGGMNALASCAPTVVMDPFFADNGIAYCGTGNVPSTPNLFSGFWVTTKDSTSTTWNGRGLLDHSIDASLGDSITDIIPSPDYENDSTLFMVTNDNGYWNMSDPLKLRDFGLLWETHDVGKTWEVIMDMTLAMPLPGVSVDTVRIPATYPDDPEVFLTGSRTGGTIGLPGPNTLILSSNNLGDLFSQSLNAPSSSNVPLVIDTWIVIDDKTLIVSNGSQIFKTTDKGAHWKLPTQALVSVGEKVIDMQRYKDTATLLVGTDHGNMYLCQDWENDFTFTKVGESPCVTGDLAHVAFDTYFDDTGFVYAGINGSTATQGIWRVEANSDNLWDQIDRNYGYACDDVSAIRSDGNGILWALSARNVSRSVNPSESLYDRVRFETVAADEGLTVQLRGNLETAPTQTYVFAVGGNVSVPTDRTQLWVYTDTLIKTTLISPADGATAAGIIIKDNTLAHVTLMWEDMPKAQWYDYQVAYDPEFGSLIDFSYGIGGLLGFTTTPTTEGSQASVELFLGEKYYWRVRVNGSPVFSQWSDTWSFTTPLGPASAKPVCMNPTEGRTGVSLTTPLQWSSSVEATGFELMVAANCDWSDPIINLTGDSALGFETAYQITTPSLAEGTNYCWRVRAVNADTSTNSPWSDTGTFTTLVTVVAEEAGTPVWVWVVIALSAVLLVGVVVLIVRTRRPV